MDKQQLLEELRQAAAQNQISKEEVLAQFGNLVPAAEVKHLSISEVLYYIGGGIVFLGICILAYQNWDSFSSFLRVFITLGSAVACFIVGALLYRYENLRKISQAFFLISGLLAPLGVSVAFKEGGFDLNSDGIQLAIYTIIAAVFFSALWFYRQTILLFFAIVFTVGVFHFIINLIIGQNLLMENYSKVWEYKILAEGLAWLLLGYYFLQTQFKALSGVMYGFGCVAFLGAAMALGGWDPNQNVFWELIYPLLVFGIIFCGVYVKSKSFLVFGTIFLIGYILKLTGEYFTSGLGWPAALVLAGLAIMGIGFYAVRLNKKYFTAAA